MTRRYLIIAFIVFTLAITSVPVSTQQGLRDYDPWYDINDDGKIDIRDVAGVAAKFGTTGTPINKTEMLLDLQARVEALERGGFIGTPAYDSGWVSISFGYNTFTHNLGTTELVVYVIGNHSEWKIHQIKYGGGVFVDGQQGVEFLLLNNTTISLYRYPNDPFWQQARVMIWKIKEP